MMDNTVLSTYSPGGSVLSFLVGGVWDGESVSLHTGLTEMLLRLTSESRGTTTPFRPGRTHF
jgi:hypothetical protein